MTAEYDTQYRPVPIIGAEGDDPVTVRDVWDLSASINNYVKHAGHHKMISHLYIPPLQSADSVTTENVVIPLGVVFKHDCYNYIRWWAHSELTAGSEAGGDYTTWKIIFARTLYAGPTVYDSSFHDYLGCWTTFRTDTEAIDVKTGTLQMSGTEGRNGPLYVLLTAQNAEIAVVARAKLYSLDIQEIIV